LRGNKFRAKARRKTESAKKGIFILNNALLFVIGVVVLPEEQIGAHAVVGALSR
jgi:hypothetical protein